MSVSFTAVTCPKCGANLSIEDGRSQAFCTYCGTKIMVVNENEQVIRHIDEAAILREENEQALRLKQEEHEHEMQLKQMQLKEEMLREAVAKRRFRRRLSVVLGIVGALAWLFTAEGIGFLLIIAAIVIFRRTKEIDPELEGKARIPDEISGYTNKNYRTAEAILRGAGFTNIRSLPLNDLKAGLLKKPGIVENITVNGVTAEAGKKFRKDASVLITYHSFASEK